MSIIFETFGIVTLCIALGLALFVVFALFVISASGAREDKYQRLQSEISTAQRARRHERMDILCQIGAPECGDGTYSPRQVALWANYKILEAHNDALTHHEQNALVETRGYISDEYADIIEGRR